MSEDVTEVLIIEPGIEITRTLEVGCTQKGNIRYAGVVEFRLNEAALASGNFQDEDGLQLFDYYRSKKLHKVREWLVTWGKRFELLVEPEYILKTTVDIPNKELVI